MGNFNDKARYSITYEISDEHSSEHILLLKTSSYSLLQCTHLLKLMIPIRGLII